MFTENGNYIGAVTNRVVSTVRHLIGQILIFAGVITLACAAYLLVAKFPFSEGLNAELLHFLKCFLIFLGGLTSAVLGEIIYEDKYATKD